jgi:prepilin signal peptidase PulO-like enzyme (type II secretory pathway)
MMDAVQIIFLGLLFGLLLPVALIDLQEQRIPNGLNLAVAGLGLGYRVLKSPGFVTIGVALLQAVLTLGLFVATAQIMRRFDKSAYIGWGDLKLLVAVSLWVGLNGSVSVLLVASVLHIALVLAMSPWHGWHKDELRPFGPMLALGTFGVVVLTFVRDGAAS